MYKYGIGIDINHTKALQIYQKLCDDNQKSACYSLALIYYESEELKDMDKSIKYFKKLCDLGNKTGCENYSVLSK